MTATKTKPRDRQAGALEQTLRDELLREGDKLAMRLELFEQVKCEIVASLPADEDRPSLYLSAAQAELFRQFGFTNGHDIDRCLLAHRGLMEARERVGDRQKIADARTLLAAAIEAENTTRAEIGDLDVLTHGVPALSEQIRVLQEKLGELTNARVQAEQNLAGLVAMREKLRAAAPKPMREEIERRLIIEKRLSPAAQRLKALRVEIGEREKIDDQWRRMERWTDEKRAAAATSPNPSDRLVDAFDRNDPVLAMHAQLHCPEACEARKDRRPCINVAKFAEYIAELRTTTLPALRAEREQLRAEWQLVVDEIEKPLERWVETGSVLSE